MVVSPFICSFCQSVWGSMKTADACVKLASRHFYGAPTCKRVIAGGHSRCLPLQCLHASLSVGSSPVTIVWEPRTLWLLLGLWQEVDFFFVLCLQVWLWLRSIELQGHKWKIDCLRHLTWFSPGEPCGADQLACMSPLSTSFGLQVKAGRRCPNINFRNGSFFFAKKVNR